MRTATYSRASVTQTLDSVHADLDVLSLPSFMFLESFGRLNNNHTNNKKKMRPVPIIIIIIIKKRLVPTKMAARWQF